MSMQPNVTQPVMAQPVMAQPVMAQPVMARPVMAQPMTSQPVTAQPQVAIPAQPQTTSRPTAYQRRYPSQPVRAPMVSPQHVHMGYPAQPVPAPMISPEHVPMTHYDILIPKGVMAGGRFKARVPSGQMLTLTCPVGKHGGQYMRIQAPAPAQPVPAPMISPEHVPMTHYDILIPKGVMAGGRFKARVASGQMLTLTCPAGKHGGQYMRIEAPAPLARLARPPLQQMVTVYQIMIPKGVMAGGRFKARVPSGQMLTLTCPVGKHGGQYMQVQVAGSTAQPVLAAPQPEPAPATISNTNITNTGSSIGGATNMASNVHTTFVLKQKMWSMGGSFNVFNANDRRTPVFKVKGKFQLVGFDMTLLELPSRKRIVRIKKEMQFFSMPKVRILDDRNRVVCTIKQKWTWIKPKFWIHMADGTVLSLKGDFSNWNYNITHPTLGIVASVNRRFGWTDTYGIQISPGQDIPVMIACAVVVDKLITDHRDDD